MRYVTSIRHYGRNEPAGYNGGEKILSLLFTAVTQDVYRFYPCKKRRIAYFNISHNYISCYEQREQQLQDIYNLLQHTCIMLALKCDFM